MKKVFAGMFAAMAAIVLSICLTACSTSFTGTWKLSSVSVSVGGVETTMEAGKEYEGTVISKDAVVLEIKEDNTFELRGAMADTVGGTQSGTWKEEDGKYYLTAEGETIEIKMSGTSLIIEQNEEGMSVKVTLKK